MKTVRFLINATVPANVVEAVVERIREIGSAEANIPTMVEVKGEVVVEKIEEISELAALMEEIQEVYDRDVNVDVTIDEEE